MPDHNRRDNAPNLINAIIETLAVTLRSFDALLITNHARERVGPTNRADKTH